MSVSKMIMGQAANQYVAPTYVENLFSTYVFDTTGAELSIDNGIDLSTEGGLVWLKSRSNAVSNELFDTERGVNKLLYSDATTAETSSSFSLTSFNTNGFTLNNNLEANVNNRESVSWTFRKAPKFFDIVTYTGNSTAGRTISHNLGSVPGMMIVKRTSSAQNWVVYHRENTAAPETDVLYLNSTDATTDLGSAWYDTAPTSTEFTLGDQIGVNANGETYVAYLFAHNDGDGDFGLTNDQDIIKCGGYTGNGTEQDINLGFEAQWVMIKRTDGTGRWFIFDSMRGVVSDGNDAYLRANGADAENTSGNWIKFTPTGFTLEIGDSEINGGATPYIYMAIRRGPMATPTSATDVFGVDTQVNQDPPLFDSGFPVDFALTRNVSSTADWAVGSRLIQGKQLNTNNENAETSNPVFQFDFMDGWNSETLSTNSSVYSWMWKRAPSYFDVVCYDGSGSNRTISHNLGVAPEMIWVKSRSNSGHGWMTYHTGTGATHYMMVNSTAAAVDLDVIWNDTAPTSSVFSVGTGGSVNDSGKTYIAYLFATLAGVSKVGSYTGNGTSQTIDCGFSSGARFVLIKKYSTTGGWNVYDTSRGLVAGNDHRLQLEDNGAEITDADQIDPLSSGFTVVDNTTNQSGHSFIFYAIA